MLELKSKAHVYRYAPVYGGNRDLPADKMCYISLKGVSMPEHDRYNRDMQAIRSDHALDRGAELIEARTYKLIEERVAGFTRLSLDGEAVSDFPTFYANAPSELVGEVCRAVMSTAALQSGEDALTAAERKNS